MKNKLYILLFVAFFKLTYSQSVSLQWAQEFGSSQQDYISDIALDSMSNVYVVGTFFGTVDFDTGPGTTTLTSTPSFANYEDGFFAKYNSNGNLQWVKQIKGGGKENLNSITIGPNNHLYIAGWFNYNTDFDPGVGTYTLMGGDNAFFAEYDSNGIFLWVKGLNSASCNAISVDEHKIIYLTGTFEGITDFDPGVGTFTLNPVDLPNDAFVAKYDSIGNFIWAKQIGGTGYDNPTSININKSKNVITAGYFSKNTSNDFDPGAGTYSLNGSGIQSIYISCLDSNGVFVWAKEILGDPIYSSDVPYNIELDNHDNILISGTYWGTADFDPGLSTHTITSSDPLSQADAFVLKLDSLGNFMWVDTVSVFLQPGGVRVAAYDSKGEVLFAGRKYSANGIKLWNESKYIPGGKVKIDNNGSIFIGGSVTQPFNDLDPGINTVTLNWFGSVDAFLIRYDQTYSGVEEIKFSKDFLIYPNPNNGVFNIETDKLISEGIICFYNVFGQKVVEQQLKEFKKSSFDFTQFQKGIYLMEIKTKDGIMRERIVIQ